VALSLCGVLGDALYLLLASLEERSIYRVLGCFLGAGDRDDLEKGFLADEATRNRFALL